MWAALKTWTRGGSYPRAIAVLTGGTVLGQALTLAFSPILTRLFGPAEWGVYGVLIAVFGMTLVVVCLRYEVAIPAAADAREAALLVALCLRLALVLSTAATAAVALLHAWRPGWIPGLPAWAPWLLLPLLVLNAAWSVLRYWLLREHRYGVVSKTWVTQAAARIAAQLAAGAARAGWVGLYVGEIIGRATAVALFARWAAPDLRAQWARSGTRGMIEVGRRYRSFALFSLPSSIVDVLAAQLPIPILAGIYGAEAAGSFALVQRVVALPMALVGANVADAFHARLASAVRERRAAATRLFWRTAAVLAATGLLPMVALLLFAEPLFALVFGSRWRVAGSLAGLLVPWMFMQLITSPLSRLVFVLGGQGRKLIYDVAAFGSVVGVLTLAHRSDWSLTQAVRTLAWALTGCYLVYFVLLWRIVHQWVRSGDSSGRVSPPGSAPDDGGSVL